MTKPRRDSQAGHDRPLQGGAEGVGAGHAPPADLEKLEEQVSSLEERAALLEKERDEHLDDLKRVAAEFENYRKRVARDQASLAARAHERLVKELLPVLDNLERALEAATEHEKGDRLEEGVRLVQRELQQALGKEGLVEIETNGHFDPHVHEALLSQPSDQDEGAILEVLQKGYRLGDRVLRPARVVISQGE